MNLLLDTHIALWAVEDHPLLSPAARELLLQPEASVFISMASLWEIAIKYALKRKGVGAIPIPAREARRDFEEAGYALLPVRAEHVETLERLPRLHSDPFDRLLVATAIAEPLRLVTHDRKLAAYSDSVMLV